MAVVAEKSFVSKDGRSMAKFNSRDISALPWGIRGVEAFRSSISVGQTESSRAKTVYQVMIFVLTYWIYAIYTLTRRPLSVVKIALCPSCAEDGDGGNSSNLSTLYDMDDQQITGWPPFNSTNGKTLLGSMDTSLIFAYAVGLFISGYIADRVNLRYFISIGLFCSGLAAAATGIGYFARVHHLAYFLVFQILSGFMQSTGWPGLLGITAKWFGKKNRGLIIGLWSSCSFVGSILGYIVPSFFIYSDNAEDSPWGWSFITPALIAVTTAVLAFFFLVTDPKHLGFLPAKQTLGVSNRLHSKAGESVEDVKDHALDDRRDSTESKTDDFGINPGVAENQETHNPERTKEVETKAVGYLQALLIPGVVEYSMALFCCKFVSYSFNFWLPFYISVSYQGFGGQRSAWLSTLFDIGAIIGALFIGLVSDRLLSSRAVLLVPMLILGVPVLYVFRAFGDVSLGLYSVLILLLGFFINGSHVIIAGTVANDLGTHQSLKDNQNAKSVVSGIIDGTGTVGAATGPLVVGIVSDQLSWDVLFYIFMLACFLSAVFLFRLLIKDVRKLTARSKRSSSYDCSVSPIQDDVELTDAKGTTLVEHKFLETEV